MLRIIGWVIGALLLVVGLIAVRLLKVSLPLTEKEVELMRAGEFEGHPAYMRRFYVARSEGDLTAERRYLTYARVAYIVGAALIAFLLFA